MSLCTRYLIHLSHGNNFSNGEQNPPFFATWWSFFLFCLSRSCHKLHRCFKMLPQRDMDKNQQAWKTSGPFPSRQTPCSVPERIALSGASERVLRLPSLWDGLAQCVLASLVPTVPPLVTQCCKWASHYQGTALLRKSKVFISQDAAAARLWGHAIFKVPFSRIRRHQANSLS